MIPSIETLLALATTFRINDEISIVRRGGPGVDSWAIFRRTGSTLARDRVFEWEPSPSSRDEAYLARNRYTLAEAFDFFEKHRVESIKEIMSACESLDPSLLGPVLDGKNDLTRMLETKDKIVCGEIFNVLRKRIKDAEAATQQSLAPDANEQLTPLLWNYIHDFCEQPLLHPQPY